MREPSDQTPSSLDPELLRELQAAEAGLPSDLLNDDALIEMDSLDDDSPLVEVPSSLSEPVDPPAQDDGIMATEDIDALLQMEPASSEAPAAPAKGLLSEEAIDALMAADPADAPTSEFSTDTDADTDTDTDADADAEPGQMSESPADSELTETHPNDDLVVEPDTAETPDTPDPEDLNATNAVDSTDDTSLGEAIETPSAQEEAPADQTVEEEDGLTQEDFDSFLQEQLGEEASGTSEEADTPVDDSADTSDMDVPNQTQDELDALLSMDGEEDPAPDSDTDAPAPADSEVPPLSMSEDELSEMLDGGSDATDPAPDDTADDAALDEVNIDALLSESSDDQMLDGAPLDTSVVPSETQDNDPLSVDQSDIDSMLSDLDSENPASSSDATDEDEDIDDISQDMIDALIANAQDQAPAGSSEATSNEIGSENLAAAATAADTGADILAPSDLDRLIDESRGPASESPEAEPKDPADAPGPDRNSTSEASAARPGHPRRFRKPGVVLPFLQKNLVRTTASLLVGVLAATATMAFLYANREVIPMGVDPEAAVELQIAMERAQDELNRGDYVAAINELERPVAYALPSQLRNDALYMLLEARVRAFRGEWGTDAFDTMTSQIDDTIQMVPAHPRAPEALYWKAQLFTPELPQVALEIYDQLFDQYSTAEGMDKMLLDASRLARAQNDPLLSAIRAQDLLRRFPGSEWAGEAILAIGDANAIAGNTGDARTTFVRIAESQPDTALGAKAFLRLGQLAYDEGQYDLAIAQLARRLETTTTTEGNDEVYLLLARAQRKAGDLNAARDTLTDLLNIFEPGAVTPQAYIDYTQVLDALGERDKAVKAAERAALEYPNNPDVLRNNGEIQGLDGNPLKAAIAMVAAEKAGAADPNLLLSAARYYRAANMPDEAMRTFNRLKTFYGGTPASLEGGIEAAELRYGGGDAEGALEDLKSLQAATRGTEAYLPTIQAMQRIYNDLGLKDHVKTMGREITQLASDPEALARAAIQLIRAGDLESAQRAIDRLDFNGLKSGTAFDVLMEEGKALLSVAPQRGLDKMEEAYFNYPDARSKESDQELLRTYLATGRAAAARRMVMDLKADVDNNPVNTPYLVDAAIAWGDYLYDKGDYRTAVFAYTTAEEAGDRPTGTVAGLRSHPDWAKYQRANALLRLADYTGCLTLYDQIAASQSPWAEEAAVKARLARLEQRQRGVVTADASAQAG